MVAAPCVAFRGRLRAACRAIVLVCIALMALPILTSHTQGMASNEVHLLTVDGVINPLTARYLTRELHDAAAAGAHVVVVRLDTPGGLESSMREMSREMLNSPVPVVVYVAPSGARAASAGMFITIAAHVAAMAPGTNIGAAHPVGLGSETDPVMSEKLANDAAALARSIAVARGRNADWAERAVRESVSITADEALDENVIDLVAVDLQDLVEALNGRTVVTTSGELVLHTEGARLVERPMSFPERILQTITDPNIAYLLFTVGMIGIIAELYNPGTLFPGILGSIALILAFVAFGSLPINWAAVLFLLIAVGLFIAELSAEGIGLLAVGAIVAFVLGSLMLFTPITPTSPVMPVISVSLWLIAAVVAIMVVMFLLVLRAVFRARRAPVTTGIEGLIGSVGVVVTDLAPSGVVRVDTEEWSAVSLDGIIQSGEEVHVVDVVGVTLRVKRR